MYVSSSRSSDAASGVPRRMALRLVSGNVLALGTVSLITDISSEMVTAILPVYLVIGLGLNPLQFGLLDGLYQGVTALVRLAGGYFADRWRRLRLVAGSGYALSAVAKLGLIAAGRSVPLLGVALAVDRIGKGLRTAPRDALISLSSSPETQGSAFGIHRAMDTVGALAGPFVAFAVLGLTGDAFDAVFVVSFCVALLGLAVLVLFVREKPPAHVRPSAVPRIPVTGLLRLPAFRRVCAAAVPLSLATISDSFLFLLLQARLDFDAGWFPLLPVGVAASFLVLAAPLGWLADRVGRSRVLVGGYLAVIGCYLLLTAPGLPGPVVLVGVLVLRGVAYAATDGVLMALAGPLLPENLRASGLALLQTGQALAAMAAAWLFGAVWTWLGPDLAVWSAVAALAAAVLVARPLLRGAS
ncbi:MFS transporter [Rhizohabitans arisaemae]|uniref:MFS transporter n=1 Tax=Rhizohabitans arisaemae TaxID=2720610 RepID=UPI0024B1736B|nr:MFS transporter [Rhizohabitans arisaemae]